MGGVCDGREAWPMRRGRGRAGAMAAAMAAEAAERHLGLLRDEREAEVAQSRCGTPTGHRLGGGTGALSPVGNTERP